MDTNLPRSGSPVTGSKTQPNVGSFKMSSSPVTPPSNLDFNGSNSGTNLNKKQNMFMQGLTSLFGFRKRQANKQASKSNLEFIKVDAESDLRVAQAKIGRVFKSKLSGKLEELFDSWLNDTAQTYASSLDRQKRIAELQYAVDNNSFLSQASSLYADEACQAMDNNGKLIQIECADQRMQERMEDLLIQWGVTQNRLRSVAYNLAVYGDAFWSNKVTGNGIVRATPLHIHQVKERLEFNPVQVQADMESQKGYVSAMNRNEKLKTLFKSLEGDENEDYSDLFDTKLFGFAMAGDMVVAPWVVTHFRLNADQSVFFPMGESVFLKCLAPFRQLSATKVLQSLARVKSFPVTVYSVKTHPGMDEAQQFDKINDVREQYENIGEGSVGNEAISVNTTLWVPEGSIDIKVHSPDININATNDLEMYQDEVAIASGIPKGYLIQEYGGYGNSAISLIEQFKPFARKVYTVQSAILEGLSNMFRLHFAITGEFDYRSHFVLSMKFPNEEASDARNASKSASLELSANVIDLVANLVGNLDAPLPSDVIQDILKKFSFLDPNDIKKWIRPNPNAREEEVEGAEEFEGGGGDFGGGGMPPGGGDMGIPPDEGMDDLGDGAETGDVAGDLGAPGLDAVQPSTSPAEGFQGPNKREAYLRMERKIALKEKQDTIRKRYHEGKQILHEQVLKEFSKIDEATINNRHYKSGIIEPCNIPMYELFASANDPKKSKKLKEQFESPAHSSGTNEWTTINVPQHPEEEEEENATQEEIVITKNEILSMATAIYMAKEESDKIEKQAKEQENEDKEHQEKILNMISTSLPKNKENPNE